MCKGLYGNSMSNLCQCGTSTAQQVHTIEDVCIATKLVMRTRRMTRRKLRCSSLASSKNQVIESFWGCESSGSDDDYHCEVNLTGLSGQSIPYRASISMRCLIIGPRCFSARLIYLGSLDTHRPTRLWDTRECSIVRSRKRAYSRMQKSG